MMRSLYSAVSGMQVHQIKMDVLSNNIANVNTVGFKKSQVTFQDMLYQTLKGAQEGTADYGGVNPQQIGLGVMIGSISTIHTQGASATSGKSTDLMIQGEGFFVLTDGTNTFYTRAGAFTMDNEGNLVNSANGLMVCDEYGDPITINNYGGNINVAPNGTISYVDEDGDAQTAGPIGIATFTNAQGLLKAGENMYIQSLASGDATMTTPGDNAGTLIAGALEMSNVDLAQEFVDMIIAQRGFQANSKAIRTTDEMLQELINIKR